MCLEKWINEVLKLYDKGYGFWQALEMVKKRIEGEKDGAKTLCIKESNRS